MYRIFKLRYLFFILFFCVVEVINSSSEYKEKTVKLESGPRPIVTCTVGECEPAFINSKFATCVGHIKLNASATDKCSLEENLIWEYKIDAFNDGVGIYSGYDFRVGALSKKAIVSGDTLEYSHNPYADDRYNPFEASGTYPIGVHKICWFVENECGDAGVCCTLFEIKDCKAPTPNCIIKSLHQIPATGCIDIWAKDLNRGSNDNCTSQEDLKFYLDEDPNKTSVRICCDDLVANQACDSLVLSLSFWVEDEEGNKDFCNTVIIIEDNFDLCCCLSGLGRIAGEINTIKSEIVSPVNIDLIHTGVLISHKIGGPYSFGDLRLNTSYTIIPSRNDEHINGVSTQDITIMRKHVLGKSKITNPYILIAADVNNSKSITAADISEIRKLILGEKIEFSKVPSWTFVPARYVFPDVENPWKAPRIDSINFSITSNQERRILDFVGIKMGDVSVNARASSFSQMDTRISTTIRIGLTTESISNSDEVIVHLNLLEDFLLSGIQFTFEFDNNSYKFVGASSDIISIRDENFGLHMLDQGLMSVSWDDLYATSIKRNSSILRFRFRKMNSNIEAVFRLTSRITKAEIYSQDASFHIESLNSTNSEYLNIRLMNSIVDESLILDFNGLECEAVEIRINGIQGNNEKGFVSQLYPGINRIPIAYFSSLAKGIYVLEVRLKDSTYLERFIKN